MRSIDTETGGTDLRHGQKPFYITTCDEEGVVQFWEWWMDPMTRQPEIPDGDLDAIREWIACDEGIVAQNFKFDLTALSSIGIGDNWPWESTHDTLIAGHLLASNHKHDLTSMALEYLDENIQPYEDRLKVACTEARRMVRSKFPEWRIAKEGQEGMPSVKGSGGSGKGEKDAVWKNDTWLPRCLARELAYPDDHPWWTVLRDYANMDSSVTLPLFRAMEKELHRRGLWRIYEERMKVVPIAYRMEERGVTLNRAKLEEQRAEYVDESEAAGKLCVGIAKTYQHKCRYCEGRKRVYESGTPYDSGWETCKDCKGAGVLPFELALPKTGVNNSLREFVFDVLKLEKLRNPKAKTDAPAMDKAAINHYIATLDPRGKPWRFMWSLVGKRSRDTALSYMEGYEKFMKTVRGDECVIHPSLNPTGTFTLRWSSSNPNEQNISAKEDFNLRAIFGPHEGREWYSLDARNLERRIPAYEAIEQAMIDLFERSDEAPYYGSEHAQTAHILFPELFNKCRGEDGQLDGRLFKKMFPAVYSRNVKGFNFAMQYECGEATADRTSGVRGSYHKFKSNFPKLNALNAKYVEHARRHGYVETIPDRTVDPEKGYPIICGSVGWGGRVKPTIPLNYHVQSTACWWMMMAMIRVDEQLRKWNAQGFDGHMVLQVHDELVLDFPRGRGAEPWRTNLPRVRKIQQLMARGGQDIGVPTPVSVEYHSSNWSEGIAL